LAFFKQKHLFFYTGCTFADGKKRNERKKSLRLPHNGRSGVSFFWLREKNKTQPVQRQRPTDTDEKKGGNKYV